MIFVNDNFYLKTHDLYRHNPSGCNLYVITKSWKQKKLETVSGSLFTLRQLVYDYYKMDEVATSYHFR